MKGKLGKVNAVERIALLPLHNLWHSDYQAGILFSKSNPPRLLRGKCWGPATQGLTPYRPNPWFCILLYYYCCHYAFWPQWRRGIHLHQEFLSYTVYLKGGNFQLTCSVIVKSFFRTSVVDLHCTFWNIPSWACQNTWKTLAMSPSIGTAIAGSKFTMFLGLLTY